MPNISCDTAKTRPCVQLVICKFLKVTWGVRVEKLAIMLLTNAAFHVKHVPERVVEVTRPSDKNKSALVSNGAVISSK